MKSIRITVRKFLPEGQVFAKDAWGMQIGRIVPVQIEPGHMGLGKILAADIAADGNSVDLTLEIRIPEERMASI